MLDILHGWSPNDGDDEDVNVSQDMRFMTIKSFPSSSSTYLSPLCPPLEPPPTKTCPSQSQSTPLPTLTRASHTPVAPSSDRRAQRNRSRDPSWVPRPRNAFIIFRCEYSRKHSQSSQDSPNDESPNDPSMKTLSKRAAEAWRQLSPEGRDQYKLLADKEREEHARLYPHYRFRPVKRQPSGARKTSCEPSKCPTVVFVEPSPVPSTHVPSVLASAPQKSCPKPSAERTEACAPVPTATPFPEASSYGTDSHADLQMPFTLDYNDPTETTPPSDSSQPFVGSYTPYTSTVGTAANAFLCDDPVFNVDFTHEDLEQAQALEAYAIGLYNYDLLSPFTFPEYS